MAVFSDDFNRPNNTDLGSGWQETSGDWSVAGNQLSPGSAGGTIITRAAAPLDSSDHYARVTIAATTAASHGLWIRGNATGGLTSGYLLRNDGSSWDLFSVTGGGFTVIGSFAAAAVPGDVVRLQAIGSAIKGTINGIDRITVTNSSVPTGTSVGLRSESSGAIRFDDFEAGDISSGMNITLTPATTTETAQPLTGTKAGTLAPATESASAQPLTGSKVASLAPAAESTAALFLTGVKSAPLSPATETEEALPLGAQKRAPLTPAAERSIAVPLIAPLSGEPLRPADRLTATTDGPALGASSTAPVLAASSTSGG